LPLSDIMIVDDNPANLKLLEDMLRQQGHEVRAFPLGRLALAAAAKNPPDLVLLDVNMPEMNGYEVCERLKSATQLSDVPVIFLSALHEIQDKVRAFHSGAVDYVSKPFQFEEVHARVDTHLQLHRLQRALRLHNESLEEAVAVRTRELAQANARLTILDRSKGEFLNLISHEFRTPLIGIFGAGELIFANMPVTDENDKLQGIFERSRRRILSILDDALLLTEIDVDVGRFRSGPVSLRAALNRAVKGASDFAHSRRVQLMPAPPIPDLIVGDEELMVRAFQALLETAVKFSHEGQSVQLSTDVVAHWRRVIIESCGLTIPDPALPHFFDIFAIGQAITPGGDLGLGPPVAFRILSLFGASVAVTNREPSGIRLCIALQNAAGNPRDCGACVVDSPCHRDIENT
jgi:two-component system sensor histidine kinase/response regulator